LAYTHMELDTLVWLFDTPSIEADCRQAIGCSVAEIRMVFTALMDLHDLAWHHRLEELAKLTSLARTEMEAAAASPDNYVIAPEVKEEGIGIWNRAWANPADASVFPAELIAREAHLTPEAVARILDAFAYDMVERDPADTVQEFFNGRSPLNTRPLLRAPSGDSVMVHPGLLFPAIRPRVEEILKSADLFDRYSKHRGQYLEEATLGLLAPHFPGCMVHHSLEYFVPDPKAAASELEPSNFTKLVEGDGLLVVDDVAIIVEAKAGGLTDLSRTGDAAGLARDLRKIVTAASLQTKRLADRIRVDRGLRLRDGSWLDLDHIREVHSIAVSLTDLSGIATVTSELVRTGILTESHLPWTVSLHDLRIITEIVDRPAELLLYLRRRTEPEVTRFYHAIDELDFFLEFCGNGLYVEPDPDRIQAELPQLGERSVAERRRYQRQGLEMLTSRTDELDAWYFYKQGVRKSPAEKPRFVAISKVLALVDAIAAQSEPGWLRIGATLLDASGPMQRKWGRHSRELLRLSAHDHRWHTLAVIGGSRADNSFVLVWASAAPVASVAAMEGRLRTYVSAKKHQAQAAFAAGLLFVAADADAPRGTVYDNRRPGPDVELDTAVALLGLQPLNRRQTTVPRPGRAGRTTKKAK